MNRVKLIDITPSSISQDKKIRALAEAFDNSLLSYITLDSLQVLTNIENLTGNVLDHIAYQLHVDNYDITDSDEIKREMILASVEIHRRKGTQWAVARAVETIFKSVKVEEWFEYGGEPYGFRVSGVTAPLTGSKDINRLATLINDAKNKRSWLEYIQFRRIINATEYVAGALSINKRIVIDSDLSTKMRVGFTEYITGAISQNNRITINTTLNNEI